MSARPGFRAAWLAASALGLAVSVGGVLGHAAPLPDKDDVRPAPVVDANRRLTYGKELFELKGRCTSCHGWAGDGRGQPHSAGNAANLRKSQLDRDRLIQVISCGLPGTPMPHFDAYGYTDDKCYGMTAADMGANIPPDAPRSLQRREIEVLVDYLQAKIVGHGEPTRQECIEFNGSGPECNAYPEAH